MVKYRPWNWCVFNGNSKSIIHLLAKVISKTEKSQPINKFSSPPKRVERKHRFDMKMN